MGDKKELFITKSGGAISVTLNGNILDLLDMFSAAATAILKARRISIETLHKIIDIAPYDGNTAEIAKALSMAKFKGDFHDDKDAGDIDLGEGEVAITKKRMEELGRKIFKEHLNKADDMIEDAEMATLMKINDAIVIMKTVEKITNALFEDEDASDERPS